MAKVLFNSQGMIETPTLLLQHKNFETIGNGGITNVSGLTYKNNFNDANEISFKIHKFNNGEKKHPLWDSMMDFKIIYIPQLHERFEISVTTSEEDPNDISKSITGTSLCEAELSQITLRNVQINTETDMTNPLYDENFPTVLYRDPEEYDSAENLAIWAKSKYDYLKDKTAYPTEKSVIARKKSILKHASLLHRVLEKAPHYSILYVADTLKKLKTVHEFTFDGTDILSALKDTIADDFHCLFIFNSETRTISVLDLYSTCNNCGYRGDYMDECPECGSHNIENKYGEDTNILINSTNLTTQITLDSNSDSLKNCFYITGADDAINYAIVNVNPNGTQYIYYFSDETLADMPTELQNKLKSYNTLYDEINKTREYNIDADKVAGYNKVINYINTKFASMSEDDQDKIEYPTLTSPLVGYPAVTSAWYSAMDVYYFLNDSMMPVIDVDGMGLDDSITAIQDGLKDLGGVAVTGIKTITQSAVKGSVEALVKTFFSASYYDMNITDSSLSDYDSATDKRIWSGTITLTSHSQMDENNQYLSKSVKITTNVIESTEKYIEQKITRMTNRADDIKDKQITSIKLAEDKFKEQLGYYSLTELNNLKKEFEACRDIAVDGFTDESVDVQYNNSELKDKYVNFYSGRIVDIQDEIKTRESQIEVVNSIYNTEKSTGEIQDIVNSVKAELDLENYLGEELYMLWYSYRREDDYSNDNYSSTGLDDVTLIKRATELVEAAKKELYKAGNLQYSLSATMGNLLALDEFKPIKDKFEVGNFIKVGIDDKVYSLRLMSYETNFDSIQDMSVEFSTVEKVYTGYSDVQSVLDASRSMATSYSSVKDQVDKSKKATDTVNDWSDNGINGDNTQFANSSEQTILINKNGILGRSYDDQLDEFSLKQFKLVNNGMYFTKDGWQSIETGIGRFTYRDINGNLVEDYGIIAKTVVGNLIIGKELQIYNEDKSIVIDENGLTIDGGYLKIKGSEVGSDGKTISEVIIDLDTAQKLVALAQQAADKAQESANQAQASANNAQKTADEVKTVTNNLVTETNEIRELAEKGVDHVTTYFYQSNSATELVGGEWTTNSVTWISGKYVWQKVITYYKDGTDNSQTAKAICISGANGQNGKPGENGVKGKGVKSITPQYAISDSNVVQPNEGWSDKEPAWSEGKYIWTRTLVIYDDNTQETTTPIVSNGLNSALSISTAARKQADSAKSTADSANTTASEAKSTADSASQTANKASEDASDAVDKANIANTNASTALDTANEANETANSASTKADNATKTANSASEKATSASNDASTAIETSNAAKTVSESAKSIADTAKSLADSVSDDLSTNYSTTQQVEKKIDDKADSITSSITTTISTTYETKADSSQKLVDAKSYADGVGSDTLTSANKNAKSYADTAESNANKNTATQLTSYSTTEEMNSAISQEAGKITTSVSEKYATKATVADNLETAKSYADGVGSNTLSSANTTAKGYADSAESNAKTYTTNQLKSYSTAKDVESKIEQSANAIKQTVSETYVTNTTYATDIKTIQGQIDGNIQTWSGKDVPTLKNEPASTWSDDEKATHIGDIYYDGNNHAYRFRVDDGIYSWQILTDTDVTKALSDAADAMDKATSTEIKLLTDYKTASDTTSEINQTKNGILQTVKDTYAESATVTNLSNDLKTNYSTTKDMQSAIDEKADSITLAVSEKYQTIAKSEEDLNTAKSYADGVGSSTLSSAKADATAKANAAQKNAIADTTEKLKSYSTTKDMNSAISEKADEITLAVSETYSTKKTVEENLATSKSYADGVGSSTLESAKTDATTKANQAKSDAIADTDKKLTSYSTTEQMNSAIKTSADNITSTVSKTYSTKEEVANIQVGGRNLYRGTKDFSGEYDYWTNSYSTYPNKIGYSYQWVKETETYNGFTVLSKSEKWNGLRQYVPTESGQQYTLSGYVKVSSTTNVYIYADTQLLVKQISPDMGWVRIYATYTAKQEYSNIRIEHGDSNVTLSICGLKFEKGNKATDWTPAPEDVSSDISTAKADAISSANASTDEKLKSYETITNVDSKISQSATDITSTVKKTYETIDNVNKVRTSVTEAETKAQQSLDQFLWLVKSGSSSTSLTLTDSAITAITKQFTIKSPDGSATIIEGGKLKTDALKSNNYVAGSDGTYSAFGTFLDLSNGEIHTPGFYLDSVGNAFYQGTVNADAGYFGDANNNWYIGSAEFDNIRNKDDALVSGVEYSALISKGNAALTAGHWYLMSQDGSLGIQSGWTTINGGNYVFDKATQKYYDMGMVEPIFDSKNEWDNKFLYIRRVQDPSSSQATWEYLFKVDKDGTIYENGTKLSDKYARKDAVGSTYLPLTGGTVTGNLTVNGTLTATASKANQLTHTLSINGKSWNGSADLTVGTIGVAYGGTGKSSWTVNGIVYASASGTLSQLPLGTAGYLLQSGGTSVPSWVNPSTLNVASATKATQDGNGNTISDTYLRKDFDSVGQNVSFGGLVDVDDLTAGTLLVSGVARFANGLIGNLKGTASNVPWSGITDKPSTFTPSAHTHTMSNISDWGTYVYSAQNIRTKNTVLAAPNGTDGKATFRTLVEADIPTLSKSKVGLSNVDNTADSVKSVSSATKLTTARNITIGSLKKSFDGTVDISFSLADIGASSSGHTHNYASKVTLAGTDYSCVSNAIIITKANLQTAIGSTGLGLMTAEERSKLNSIKVSSGGTIDFSGVTASGALTATVGNDKTVTLTHNTSGVKAGTYKSVTVDTYGHVTAGTNPTTLSGYGITDALSSSTKYALSDSVGGNALKANLLTSLGRLTDANITVTGNGGVTTFKASSSMTANKPPKEGHILHFYWDNKNNWDSQMCISADSSPTVYVRGMTGQANTYGDWKTLLDSTNYTDYTVKKDGTGASGTWDISITGNAVTATKATSADSATKATQDSDGNPINTTYLKLIGGSMTGTIASSASQILRWTPSTTDNNDTGCSWYGIGTYKASDGYKRLNISHYFGINFTTKNSDNYFTHNGNTIITSANIGSQSVASATKATQDGAGNVITSKYVTVDTTQTISGAKTFSKETTISSATASINKTTGALKVKGGIASEGQISADKVMIGDAVTLEYNTELQCLNFVFA